MTELSPITFPDGTFSPDPGQAPAWKMVAAQGRIETKLFLRHGEQLLLSLIIPFVMLIVLSRVPILDSPDPLREVVPVIFAVAAMSSGFTGQAIALAFDRRYGALKRTGASGVSAATIIAGKAIAVIATVLVQTLVLGVTALLLGWRPDGIGVVLALLTLAVGVATFCSLGLLMGGTMSSELVLALANLIWVVLVGLVGWVLVAQGLTDPGLTNLIPSVALASGLTVAFDGALPWGQLAVLLVWLVAASAAAVKWFRFAA